MNGVELYILGRRLMKLGEEAMPRAGFRKVPSSVQIVLLDISDHPDSSISQIVARTGLPQSLVSEAVARMRDGGALTTTTDPGDGRRTLVRMSADIPQRMAQAPADPVEPVLSAALGVDDPAVIARIASTLTELAALFTRAAGPPPHTPHTPHHGGTDAAGKDT